MKTTKSLRLGITRSIFTNRYLFTACTVFMLAATLAFFVDVTVKIILIAVAVSAALAVLVCYVIKRKKPKHRTSPLLLLTLVCLAIAATAVAESLIYFDVHYAKYTSILTDSEDGIQEVTVSGTAVRRRYSSSNISSFEIQLDSIDGNRSFGNTYAILDCMYIGDLQVGDSFTVCATPTALSDYSPSVYDEKELIAQNFSIAFTSYSEESLVISGHAEGIQSRLLRLRDSLTQRLCLNDAESGGVASALLLGDKSMLPDTVRRDFSRSGVSHILALSGLHVTVLFGILDFILRIFLIPKKARIAILSASALLYLALIGFLPSAVRAVIMLFFTYAAFVFSEDGDPVTSLGFAGALIIAFSPTSVADLGFWMSFSATLGIVCISPWLSQKTDALLGNDKRRKKTFIRRMGKKLLISSLQLISGIFIGVASCTFTLAAVSVGVGSISLLSPVTTLIMTPAAGFMLITSVLSLIFYSAAPGVILASGVRLASKFMAGVAESAASSSTHIISLCQPYVLPICAAMIILALAPLPILRKGKNRPQKYSRIIIVPILGIVTLATALSISAYTDRNDLDVTYLTPSTQSEFIILQNKKDAVICDISNGGNSSLSRALRVAKENGAVDIAAIMLTDYHSATPGSLYKAFSENTVKRLWLPEPQNEDDYFTMLSCIEKAELSKPPVEVSIYKHGDSVLAFGEVELSLHRAHIERSVRPILLLAAETPSFKLAYVSPTYVECEDEFEQIVSNELSDTDALIFGRNGPVIKQTFTLPIQAEEIIFASNEVAAFAEIPDSLPTIPNMTVGEWRIKTYLSKD